MKPEWIARQSRRPAGWVGEIVARVMARDTRAANATALDLLSVEPGDVLLEIGCGHGETLAKLARRASDGFVAGIDPSDVMVRLAARRVRREINLGRAEVRLGEAARLPYQNDRFDAVLAVHVLYFWPEPTIELREIRRVLRIGGTLVLGFRPDGPEARSSLPGSVYHLRSIREVEKSVRETGFEAVRVVESAPGTPPFVCVIGCAAQKASADGPQAPDLVGA